jgi:small subunit ribosomal protein S4
MLKGEKCFSSKCPMEKRGVPPGQRPTRRRKISEHALQLREKQKARYTYGMLERQFRRFFHQAERRPGITGENFIELLERRLDNVVYRLNFASSRSQARQIVRHGHISLNGRKVDIPSSLIKLGDVIAWREEKKRTELYHRVVEEIQDKAVPDWLSVDKENISGKVIAIPTSDQISVNFSEKTIVGYYSR